MKKILDGPDVAIITKLGLNVDLLAESIDRMIELGVPLEEIAVLRIEPDCPWYKFQKESLIKNGLIGQDPSDKPKMANYMNELDGQAITTIASRKFVERIFESSSSHDGVEYIRTVDAGKVVIVVATANGAHLLSARLVSKNQN